MGKTTLLLRPWEHDPNSIQNRLSEANGNYLALLPEDFCQQKMYISFENVKMSILHLFLVQLLKSIGHKEQNIVIIMSNCY